MKFNTTAPETYGKYEYSIHAYDQEGSDFATLTSSSSSTTHWNDAYMYMINVTALDSAIDKAQTAITNKSKYTKASVENLVKAYASVTTNYTSTDISTEDGVKNMSSLVQTAATTISDAVDALVEVHTVDFVNNAGETVEERIVANGAKLGTLPTNTTTAHIDGTQTHSVYSWKDVTSDTVVSADMTVDEVVSSESCSFSSWTYAGNEQHTRKCSVCEYTETEDCNIVDGKCTVCSEVFIDYTAYDSAVASIKTNDGQYTDASFSAYTDAVNAAKIPDADRGSKTQEEVDEAAAKIIEAEQLLRDSKVTVKFAIYENDGATLKSETSYECTYGEKLSLDASGTVTKWVITDEKGNDTKLAKADSEIEILATKNQTVYAYLKAEEEKDPGVEYAKVVYYGKNGVMFDVKYIEKQDTYTVNSVTEGVTAPTVSFYDFSNWTLESIKKGAEDVIQIYAKYAPKADTLRCNIHYNGSSWKVAYDNYVFLGSSAASKSLALSTSESEEDVLTYIGGDSFYAPHTSDIYVVEVSEKKNSAAITGSYALTDSKGAVFNAKFYATDMSAVQEYGVVVINPETGAQVVVKADSCSQNNEYSVRVNLLSTTSLTSLNAKAYVVINGETIYSDVVSQAL